jgi:uncharacterized protein YjbI with pentapeptide repeats
MRWGNRNHLAILDRSPGRDGVRTWNSWRRRNRSVIPDLSGFDFSGRDLEGIDLRRARLDDTRFVLANLARADLRGARLREADLAMANLHEARGDDADLSGAYLGHARLDEARFRGARFLRRGVSQTDLEFASLLQADFSKAKLREAKLVGADLTDAKFDRADLRKADLGLAILRGTSLRGANLRGAEVWRISARNLGTDRKTIQKSLSVRFDWWTSRPGWLSYRETTVDDIHVAQFFDIVSEYGAVAKLVKAGAMSVVLVLGRFTARRKVVLDALAHALRLRGKTPIVFDFPGPENRELSDTVRFVAAMAEFVIVDLTAPSSVPLELQAFVPDVMVPVVPIIKSGHRGFAMFADLQRRYLWVLPPVAYASIKELVRHLDAGVIRRAERMVRALQRRRRTAANRPQPIRRAT